MKVLISGAGIAGLTLAWWLERMGWEVELIERSPEFRDGGYMIDFFGPGYEVAERMGLRPRLHRMRKPVTGVSYVNQDGKVTSGLGGASFASMYERIASLLRGDLARAINDEVRSPVRYGVSVSAIEQSDEDVTVTLTDGSVLSADLLVGADGAHSRVRELVFGPEERFVRYLGYHTAAYFASGDELQRELGTRYQLLNVPDRMVGAYALDQETTAMVFLHRHPDPRLPEDPVAAMHEHYGHLDWILPKVLPQCPRPPELYYDQVTQVEMDRWHDGRVVLLGDACQAVSLFAGHGASMAMAAAWTLADELRADEKLSDALVGYQRRMGPSIVETQRFGRRFIRWMAPENRWWIMVRDWIVRLGNLPGVRGMLRGSLDPGSDDLITARSADIEQFARRG